MDTQTVHDLATLLGSMVFLLPLIICIEVDLYKTRKREEEKEEN